MISSISSAQSSHEWRPHQYMIDKTTTLVTLWSDLVASLIEWLTDLMWNTAVNWLSSAQTRHFLPGLPCSPTHAVLLLAFALTWVPGKGPGHIMVNTHHTPEPVLPGERVRRGSFEANDDYLLGPVAPGGAAWLYIMPVSFASALVGCTQLTDRRIHSWNMQLTA